MCSHWEPTNKRSKWSYIELVRAITCTFTHGFQNNFTQLLSSRRRSAIQNICLHRLKVEVIGVK